MNMWCPNCDLRMIEEEVIRGDEVIGVVFVCDSCGEEIEEWEIEGDTDE
jgi:DNA-directed RNA polymerase subunit M/transcription elongation factor TFIIS